jgi:hypothetical protein
MRTRFFQLATLLLLLVWTGQAASGLGGTVQLQATRTTLLADGKQTTEIRAFVRDTSGHTVANGVEVQFQTTAGTLSPSSAATFGGIATVRLTSASIAGTASVTAFIPGASSDILQIVFTDDPAATFEGNTYVAVSAPSYLAYSATDRVIEADGNNGGAKLTYRNITISANRLQLRCDDMIVRASDNIVLQKGRNIFHASRLYYSLQSGQGYAIAELDKHLQPVIVSGADLKVEHSPTPIPSSYMLFPELQIKLVIVARSITYFPGDRLQFRRPRFYQDQKQILSLPYYELSLNSQELFSDQFISLGTSGFGLEVPLYYNLTPRSTGIVYVRHQEQLGRGYYATYPGWSVDVMQSYSEMGDHRYEGEYGLTGLLEGNWGFRWNHSQEFNSATQGSFDLEFPNHDSIFTATNISQQTRRIRWGADVSAGQLFTGGSDQSLLSNVYVESQPHPFVVRGMQYAIGTAVNTGIARSADQDVDETTENITLRAFSRPRILDRRTTLTDSFTVGQLWSSSGASGPIGLATLSLDHTLPGGGGLNLTYDLVSEPQTFESGTGKHRLSLTYAVAGKRRFQLSLLGSMFLDTQDSTLLADGVYRLNRDWRLLTSITMQRFQGISYQDFEFAIGRRIGARELQLVYSTYNNRISVDLTATRF